MQVYPCILKCVVHDSIPLILCVSAKLPEPESNFTFYWTNQKFFCCRLTDSLSELVLAVASLTDSSPILVSYTSTYWEFSVSNPKLPGVREKHWRKCIRRTEEHTHLTRSL
jgi:hypothetical protein